MSYKNVENLEVGDRVRFYYGGLQVVTRIDCTTSKRFVAVFFDNEGEERVHWRGDVVETCVETEAERRLKEIQRKLAGKH